MCGISGFCLNPLDIPNINSRTLAKALLLGIEERGGDATGVAFRTPSGSSPIQIHKAPVTASEFIKRMPMPRKAQVAILHTRFATQGDPRDNNNNHPIYNSGIVGVHNGVITNDDLLFREAGVERHGEVDSEAAFAAIANGVLGWGVNSNKRYMDLESILGDIRGSAALAWMDEADEDDVLHLAKLNSSPLVLGYTDNGSLLFASTMSTLKAAEAVIGMELKFYHVKDGEYYKYVAGKLAETIDFVPSYYTRYSSYSGSTVVNRPATSQYNVTNIIRDGVNGTARRTPQATQPKPSELATVLSSDACLTKGQTLDYYDHYSERESNIDVLASTATDIHVRGRMLNQIHGYLRIGQWVETSFGDGSAYGQVYEMPQTFPHGHYIIRVLMQAPDRESGVEWVLVARTCDEFERCGEPDLKDSESDVTDSSTGGLLRNRTDDDTDEQEMAEEQAELDALLDNRMENELTVFDVDGHWDGDDYVCSESTLRRADSSATAPEYVMDGSVGSENSLRRADWESLPTAPTKLPALDPGSSVVSTEDARV